MDIIRDAQYQNLRVYFNKNLVNPILGEDYYNMASDVYMSDMITTEDIKKEFNRNKYSLRKYKILLAISLVVNILLFILNIIQKAT